MFVKIISLLGGQLVIALLGGGLVWWYFLVMLVCFFCSFPAFLPVPSIHQQVTPPTLRHISSRSVWGKGDDGYCCWWCYGGRLLVVKLWWSFLVVSLRWSFGGKCRRKLFREVCDMCDGFLGRADRRVTRR